MRLGQPVFRPFVQVSLANGGTSTTMLDGLVDTGADAILASDLLADQLEVDLSEHEGEIHHAVGGRTMNTRYKTVPMRLHPRDGEVHEHREWNAQVGFVENWHSYSLVLLGSIGFLDRFTVTASRFSQVVAVETRTPSTGASGSFLRPSRRGLPPLRSGRRQLRP